LQVSALVAVCHMAATPAGRSCLAAAGCLPRWLPLAIQLQWRPQQLLLMLPLSCLGDWTCATYFLPLERGGAWVEDTICSKGRSSKAKDSCPQLLRQQVQSQADLGSCRGTLLLAAMHVYVYHP
jgi:hypothetical protein